LTQRQAPQKLRKIWAVALKDYSVGRGTDSPLEQVGALWIKGTELAEFLNARAIPGVRAYPVRFHPSSSVLAGKDVEGVRFLVTDRNLFNAVGFGLGLIESAHCGLSYLWARIAPMKPHVPDRTRRSAPRGNEDCRGSR
jgi:hypothetical protein